MVSIANIETINKFSDEELNDKILSALGWKFTRNLPPGHNRCPLGTVKWYRRPAGALFSNWYCLACQPQHFLDYMQPEHLGKLIVLLDDYDYQVFHDETGYTVRFINEIGIGAYTQSESISHALGAAWLMLSGAEI